MSDVVTKGIECSILDECLENGDIERAREFVKKSHAEICSSEKHRLGPEFHSLDFKST